MSIRKHKESGIWWIDITPPGGKRIRRSTGTRNRKQAQEYHDRLKAELWRVHQLGDKPKRLFEEACVQFLRASEGQRDYDTKVRHVKYWREVFAGRAICSLTSEEIYAGLPTHQSYKNRKPKKLTPATRNRYLASIRRILSLCVESEWIHAAPKLSAAMEPKLRVRWEPKPVVNALISALRLPWMRDVAIVAVSTGMREDELLSLLPSDVDIDRATAWVRAENAKSGRARSVPLNDDALAVLKRRLEAAVTYVFERPPRKSDIPIKISQVDDRDLKRACKLIGIKDFRFHDFRHTWASWHVQAGTPLMVLKELGGWETLEMVQRYAHLATSHLAEHANNVTFRSQCTAQKKKAA